MLTRQHMLLKRVSTRNGSWSASQTMPVWSMMDQTVVPAGSGQRVFPLWRREESMGGSRLDQPFNQASSSRRKKLDCIQTKVKDHTRDRARRAVDAALMTTKTNSAQKMANDANYAHTIHAHVMQTVQSSASSAQDIFSSITSTQMISNHPNLLPLALRSVIKVCPLPVSQSILDLYVQKLGELRGRDVPLTAVYPFVEIVRRYCSKNQLAEALNVIESVKALHFQSVPQDLFAPIIQLASSKPETIKHALSCLEFLLNNPRTRSNISARLYNPILSLCLNNPQDDTLREIGDRTIQALWKYSKPNAETFAIFLNTTGVEGMENQSFANMNTIESIVVGIETEFKTGLRAGRVQSALFEAVWRNMGAASLNATKSQKQSALRICLESKARLARLNAPFTCDAAIVLARFYGNVGDVKRGVLLLENAALSDTSSVIYAQKRDVFKVQQYLARDAFWRACSKSGNVQRVWEGLRLYTHLLGQSQRLASSSAVSSIANVFAECGNGLMLRIVWDAVKTKSVANLPNKLSNAQWSALIGHVSADNAAVVVGFIRAFAVAGDEEAAKNVALDYLKLHAENAGNLKTNDAISRLMAHFFRTRRRRLDETGSELRIRKTMARSIVEAVQSLGGESDERILEFLQTAEQ
ncbi:hypothetical protein BJ741DRAFT_594659 [Chytriomyces cf. hyalinus JEL632]|nr:hypothetical protein BJ741DRAFT_594659 [Chytriomyces cf. hyalinus JEL632]